MQKIWKNKPPVPAKINRTEKVVKSEIELDLPLMVPDVYK